MTLLNVLMSGALIYILDIALQGDADTWYILSHGWTVDVRQWQAKKQVTLNSDLPQSLRRWRCVG